MPNRLTIKALITLFALSAIGLISAATAFAGTTTYIYDELDRLKEAQFDNGNGIKYEYDEIGNLKSKTPTGNVFSIAASAGSGGSIFPTGTVVITAGSSKNYSIVPLYGFHIVDVAVDGVSQGAVSSYPFTSINASHTISASFSNTYYFTITAGTGGTVSPSSSTIVFGTSPTFTITPGVRYQVADVKIDGVSKGAITSYTFTNITAPHTLEASFALTACANPPVRIAGKASYSTLQPAYDAAVDGDVIQVQAQLFTESLTANRNISVTIDGGYTCDYSANPDMTIIKGAPRTSSGTVRMRNIHISN